MIMVISMQYIQGLFRCNILPKCTDHVGLPVSSTENKNGVKINQTVYRFGRTIGDNN